MGGSARPAPAPSNPTSDPIRAAAAEIAMMIQQAREEEAQKSRIAIDKAQWEAEHLRVEGMKVKETLSKEIEALKAELSALKKKKWEKTGIKKIQRATKEHAVVCF
ncbi:hypothetical protein FRC03_007035 [Tulasnella sp. 419]|nr:hypothetical protein FRC02_011848 [Tulasnella sp. 418]KAG8960137.1 hypothetical protein FRC03_007035 [Tulasnella sp. 419]